MGDGRHIDLAYVVSHCEQEADAHKLKAAWEGQGAFEKVKDQKKRDEHLAMARMADLLAEHFRIGSEGHLVANPEVESLAREIDPDAFSSHEALVAKILSEGGDENYAISAARATYGDRMDAALEQASESVKAEASSPDDSQDYDKGVEDAAKWHEQRALEAERQEQLETVPARKAKYSQRAKRHRLYAKHIRSDFAEARETAAIKRARESVREEPQLPLVVPINARTRAGEREEGVPLAVQAAFRRKSEVFDDEGWT